MNVRLVILALLAAVLWAGVTYWPEDKKEETVDPAWPSLAVAEVDRIDLNNPTAEWSMLRDKDGCVVRLRGADYPAELEKFESLATFVNQNKPSRRLGVVDKERLADYGLAEPRAVLTIGSKDPFILRLGQETPTNSGVYASSSREDEVLLLPVAYVEQLFQGPDHYQDKRVLGVDQDAIEQVRVAGEGDNFEMTVARGKDDEATYAFAAPEELKAKGLDRTETSFYLHSLAHVAAKELLAPGEPAELPPLTGRVEVTLTGDKTPRFVEFYLNQGNSTLVGKSSFQPTAFLIDKREAGQLLKTSFELRKRNVVDFEASEVARQRIVSENGERSELDLTKNDSGWVKTGTEEQVAGMDMLVWRLTDLKYEAEPSAALPDTAAPALDWELRPAKGEPFATVRFYTDSAFPSGRVWLQLAGETKYYPADGQLLTDLLAKMPQKPGAAEKPAAPAEPAEQKE